MSAATSRRCFCRPVLPDLRRGRALSLTLTALSLLLCGCGDSNDGGSTSASELVGTWEAPTTQMLEGITVNDKPVRLEWREVMRITPKTISQGRKLAGMNVSRSLFNAASGSLGRNYDLPPEGEARMKDTWEYEILERDDDRITLKVRVREGGAELVPIEVRDDALRIKGKRFTRQ